MSIPIALSLALSAASVGANVVMWRVLMHPTTVEVNVPQPVAGARQPIVQINDGGALPHGGVCRSCGAGIAWRAGSEQTRCTCGGSIEVLA